MLRNCIGVPKTILSLCVWLDVLLGLRKALKVTVLIYYKAIQVKNQQRGRAQEVESRKTRQKPLSVASTMCLTLPAMVSDDTHTRQESVCFLGGNHRDMEPPCD